eukprot:7378718-Prymnesium_polylepis.1
MVSSPPSLRTPGCMRVRRTSAPTWVLGRRFASSLSACCSGVVLGAMVLALRQIRHGTRSGCGGLHTVGELRPKESRVDKRCLVRAGKRCPRTGSSLPCSPCA